MSLPSRLLLLLGLVSACTGPSAGAEERSPVDGPANGPTLPALDAAASGTGRTPRAALDAGLLDAARSDVTRPDATTSHGDGATGVDDAGSHEADADPTTSLPLRWDLCEQLAQQAQVSLPTGPTLSWARLLCDTVDLARFTRPPSPAYTARMASSYNRASRQEGGAGWYANDDSGFYLRDEGDEHVMMEAHGPGVITRLWSPNPTGTLLLYIDDPNVPALAIPMIDLLSGRFRAPWGKPFVSVAAEGYSAYFPIPYRSYARVSTTTAASLYYQVEYRSYPADTPIEAFSTQGLDALVPLARALATYAAAPSSLPALAALPVHEFVLSDATPEQTTTIGPSVLRELTVRGFEPGDERLRTTRLILTVDGERTVDVPLGDLFGTGPGPRPFESLASSITGDTLKLRWPMPVRGTLTARVESSTGTVGTLALALRHSAGLDDASHVFHARWTGVHTFSSAVADEWTLLHQQGAGWYVGTVLNVGNPTNLWWGEGDEKVFVDGEPCPSRFGTGTEDYFGFGWCSTELFARPWSGQTRADGPANAGRSSMYRWHVADAIPFTRELRFRLEVWHWFKDLYPFTLTEDAVAYWYGTAGAPAERAPLPTAAFVVPPLQDWSSPVPDPISRCRL
ncbi:MAG: hypothetical protein RLZZ450_4094 [Pseudomonadota bacterium]|jgi:hypothetical protein